MSSTRHGRTGPPAASSPTGPAQDPSEAATGPLSGESRPTLAPSLSDADLLAGRFRVLRFLGRGGMGEVYEAEDLELRERIALKVVPRELARDSRALDRFRHEITLARKVTHPNVCRLFDVFRHHTTRGEGPDAAFVTMELLPGETLTQRLQRSGRLALDEARPLVRQMIEALEAAHDAGVLHLDFKSANVMLVDAEAGERVVVTDFGLARGHGLGDEPHPGGSPQEIVGTPAYMAPEQLEGGPPTPATDIYAFGVVVYEMLTGTLPFHGGSALGAAMKRLDEPARSPREHLPDLDPIWDRAIRRCLERDPSQRFASAGELARALFGAEPREQLEAELRRMRRREWVAIAVAAVLAGALVAWGVRASRAPAPPPTPVASAQLTASAGLDVFPALSPDGALLAYASNRTGRFELYVQPVSPASGQARALTRDGNQNLQPRWSPDGRQIAFHSQRRGGLWVMPAGGGAARQVSSFGSRPVWSPDGARLAFQSDAVVDLGPNAFPARPPSTIWTVEVEGGAPLAVTRAGEPPGGHGTPSWSPDGSRLLFAAYDRRTSSLWSVAAEGGPPRLVGGIDQYVFDPAWMPDGSAVLYTARGRSGEYGIWRVPMSGASVEARGAPQPIAHLGLGTPRHLALAPSGTALVYSGMSMSSNLWRLPLQGDRPAGEPEPLTSETGRNSRPAISPDGRLVAFEKWSPGTNPDVWLLDLDRREARPLTSDPAMDGGPSFSADGRRVVFASLRGGSRTLWAVDVAGGQPERLAELPPDAELPRLSPDGDRVAFDSAAGTGITNLWLSPLAGPPRRLTDDAELIGYSCWSPDGTWLAAQRRRGDDAHVVEVDPRDGRVRPLTSGAGQDWAWSVSPDGDKIAFARLRDGGWNLWWVSRTSGEQTQITAFTDLDAYVRYPAWSPRGDQIVYEYAETLGNIWQVELR